VKKFILIMLFLFLSSCASKVPHKITSKNLVGTWLLEDYGYGQYSHSILAFLPNGEKCVVTYDFSANGNIELDYYLNHYTIEADILVTKVDYSSTPSLYPSYEIRDKIKELSNIKLVLLMIQPSSSNPRFEKHTRLVHENPERVCELVKRKLRQ